MEYIEKNLLYLSRNQNIRKKSFVISLCMKIWRSRWIADISLLLVALIWGTTYVASKDIVSYVPVMQFIFIRFLVTTILMVSLTFNAIRRADKTTWIAGMVFGLFLLATFTPPSRAAVLMSSEPIFAAIASVLILGENLSINSIIGGACIIAGMIWARKLT